MKITTEQPLHNNAINRSHSIDSIRSKLANDVKVGKSAVRTISTQTDSSLSCSVSAPSTPPPAPPLPPGGLGPKAQSQGDLTSANKKDPHKKGNKSPLSKLDTSMEDLTKELKDRLEGGFQFKNKSPKGSPSGSGGGRLESPPSELQQKLARIRSQNDENGESSRISKRDDLGKNAGDVPSETRVLEKQTEEPVYAAIRPKGLKLTKPLTEPDSPPPLPPRRLESHARDVSPKRDSAAWKKDSAEKPSPGTPNSSEYESIPDEPIRDRNDKISGDRTSADSTNPNFLEEKSNSSPDSNVTPNSEVSPYYSVASRSSSPTSQSTQSEGARAVQERSIRDEENTMENQPVARQEIEFVPHSNNRKDPSSPAYRSERKEANGGIISILSRLLRSIFGKQNHNASSAAAGSKQVRTPWYQSALVWFLPK